MNELIARLKNKTVHTPKLAIVRFLLALSTLLLLLCNDMKVVANHDYTHLRRYHTRHNTEVSAPFRSVDLFMMMPPGACKVVAIIILLAVMSGFFPQITGVLHVWVCFSVANYFMVLNGGDRLALILSVLLLPICITDPRLNQWKPAIKGAARANIFANIALFAIQVQAAIVYLYAGASKLYIKDWQDGTAVYYYTSHYRLGAPGWLRAINETITLTPFVAILTWSVLLLEIFLFACLFAPVRIKRPFLAAALIFHFLIVVDFGLFTFFLVMSALLILYLDDADDSVKLLRRIQGKKKDSLVNYPADAVST